MSSLAFDFEYVYHILLPSPSYFLDLQMPEGKAGNDRFLLKIFRAAAKKAIPCKWLPADPPTVDNWIGNIREIHEMKILAFLLRLKDDLSIARWITLIIYVRIRKRASCFATLSFSS